MAKGFSSFSPSSLSPPPDEEDGRVGNTLKAESNILMSYTQQAVYNIQHTDGGEKEEEKKDVLVPIYSRRRTSEKSRKTQHETPRKKSKKKNLQTPSSIMLIGGGGRLFSTRSTYRERDKKK